MNRRAPNLKPFSKTIICAANLNLFGMRNLIKKIIHPFLRKASAMYLAKPRNYTYKDITVLVEPTVFPPFITISTKLLLEFTETLPLKGKTFLELGCGCGIISILAAKKGAAVTATDINQTALAALENNALKNDVQLDVLYSDLFENLAGKSFDFILINPPYYPKSPGSIAESAWFCGENFQYFERLFAQLDAVSGEIYMILSEDCALETIKNIALKNGMAFALVSKLKVVGEKNYIFRIVAL